MRHAERMFSGIVSGMGEIVAIGDGRLSVRSPAPVEPPLRSGDSVAVSGVCLTAAALHHSGFSADVMPETLRRTALGGLRPGDHVNLETALRLGDVIGGHLVTGHVDAVGTVTGLREDGNARWATVAVPPSLSPLLAEKGSVAVDGISLTVVDADEASFTVSLIPHTLHGTTAGRWRPGSSVNIEVDLIARYVHRALTAGATPAAHPAAMPAATQAAKV